MAFSDIVAQLGLQPAQHSAGNWLDPLVAGVGSVADSIEKSRQAAQQEALRKLQMAQVQQQIDNAKQQSLLERFKLGREVGADAVRAGNNQSAIAAQQQLSPIAKELGLPIGPEIKGAPTGTYDWQTRQPITTYDNPATTNALRGVFGVQPDLMNVPAYDTVIDKNTGKVVATGGTKPLVVGSDRTGRYVINGGGLGLPDVGGGGAVQVTAPVAATGRRGGSSGRGGSAGRVQAKVGANGNYWTFNPTTGQMEDTGVSAPQHGGTKPNAEEAYVNDNLRGVRFDSVDDRMAAANRLRRQYERQHPAPASSPPPAPTPAPMTAEQKLREKQARKLIQFLGGQ